MQEHHHHRSLRRRRGGGDGAPVAAASPVQSYEGRRRIRRDDETYSSLPPDYFEQLRKNAVSVQRVNNVDLVATVVGSSSNSSSGGTMGNEATTTTYAYCHIPYFYPFSLFPIEDEARRPFDVQGPFEGAAAIHLAMAHLNTGNGRVIPEVQGLNETCDIRFTTELHDTEKWETTAVNRVVEVLNRDSSQDVAALPCAFLGAFRSGVTMPMSLLTGGAGYAQMSGFSTSSQLSDRSQYRLFSRVVPSDDGTAIPIIQFLRDVIRTRHVAVVHMNNPYSNSFLTSLQKAKTKLAPAMRIESIDIPPNFITDQHLKTAITFLKNTQYRYIIGIIDGPKVYERLLTEAYNQGIAGDEYVWIYTDTLFPQTITNQEHEPNSPLAVAGRGSSIVQVQQGLAGTAAFDNFVASFHELNNPEFIDYLQSKHPVYEGEPDYEPLRVERIFREADPGVNAAFLYDSTIAMGLAACRASSSSSSTSQYFNGPTHYQHIVNTTFNGVSGPIVIDPETGTRDPTSAYFQLLNFVERMNPASGKITFEAVQSGLFKDGVWEDITPYVFGDRTSQGPPSVPPANVDYNYIAPGLRGTGFALSGLVIVLSMAFSCWTIFHRKSKVVCASQPFFLHFICAGVLLMGSAIIPLSIDDKIASQRGCDIACAATPWLFIMGFSATFSALFSKTWRINKVFHHPSMRRLKVTALDVLKPLIALLAVNVLVLSLWTGLDPLHWEREILSVDAFEQILETEGHCYSGTWVPYVVVLGVINVIALIVASYQAYCARDIAVEFSESAYIGRAIGLVLLACLYGIPVLVITWTDPSSRYFVLMIIFFVCSMSVLLLIFVPKVIFLRRGNFKQVSRIVHNYVGSETNRRTDDDGGSGPFVSGLSGETDKCSDDSSESFGAKVIDTPRMRQSVKALNGELLEQNKLLRECLKRREENEKMPAASTPEEETIALVDRTLSSAEEQRFSEEEAPDLSESIERRSVAEEETLAISDRIHASPEDGGSGSRRTIKAAAGEQTGETQ